MTGKTGKTEFLTTLAMVFAVVLTAVFMAWAGNYIVKQGLSARDRHDRQLQPPGGLK